jgi:D-sedoheptulose 7-phosphate isomerase
LGKIEDLHLERNRRVALFLDFSDDDFSKILHISDEISNCLADGGTVFIIGNGGSASDATHFASELTSRSSHRGGKVISLTSDPSSILAIGNDYGFSSVFSRQIDAMGSEGDLLLALSTSGNSENIVECVKLANSRGVRTYCLLGNGGGKAAILSENHLIIRSTDTAMIQEIHMFILHVIYKAVLGT